MKEKDRQIEENLELVKEGKPLKHKLSYLGKKFKQRALRLK